MSQHYEAIILEGALGLCRHGAMESTGIYWRPIYEILEDAYSGDIILLVVNARHMKNVLGKKTDMRDSEWIATLLRAELLNFLCGYGKPLSAYPYLCKYPKRKMLFYQFSSNKLLR